MFSSFSAVVQQFFAMIMSFAKAGENLGLATVSLSEVAKATAMQYEDEAKAEREKKLNVLISEAKAQAVALKVK